MVDYAEALWKPKKKQLAPKTSEVACQVGEYFCQFCKKTFTIQNSYYAHMNRTHNLYKQTKLTQPEVVNILDRNSKRKRKMALPQPADVTFITREEMEQGVLGKDNFKCWKCNKNFEIKNSYHAHMNRTHGLYVNRNFSTIGEFKRKFPNLRNKSLLDSQISEDDADTDVTDEDQIQYHDTSEEENVDFASETDEIVDGKCEEDMDEIKVEIIDMEKDEELTGEALQSDEALIVIDNELTCDEYFNEQETDNNETEVHIKLIEEGNWVRYCCMCPFKGSSYGNVYEHVELEHPKVRTGFRPADFTRNCRICWAQFSSESSLKEHITHFKPKIVALKCRLCSKLFTRRNSLTTHFNRKHKIMLSQLDPLAKERYEVKLTADEYKEELKKTGVETSTAEKFVNEPNNVAVMRYCCQCSFSNEVYSVIYDHFIESHPNAGRSGEKNLDYNTDCRICWKTFSNYLELKRHMNRFKPSTGRFTCKICLNTYDKRNSYVSHMNLKHKMFRKDYREGEMICQDDESMVVEMLEEVQEELVAPTVEDIIVEEDMCVFPKNPNVKELLTKTPKFVKRTTTLGRKRVKPKEEQRKGTKCCQCDFQGSNYSEVYNHFIENHKHIRRQKKWIKGSCKWCWEKFDNLGDLTMHVQRRTRIIDEGPVNCEYCEKKEFQSKKKLLEHFNRVHKPKNCICEECGEGFTYPFRLEEHILRRHRPTERPKVCNVCNKTFKSNFDLKRHMFRHTGIKPYCCKHCSKQFFDRSDWLRHQVVHTGVYLYYCTVPDCKKGFQRKKALHEHVEAHHGSGRT